MGVGDCGFYSAAETTRVEALINENLCQRLARWACECGVSSEAAVQGGQAGADDLFFLPTKAKDKLGSPPTTALEGLVVVMVSADQEVPITNARALNP